MVFKAHGGLTLDHIPDDITVSELIFNPKYGRRPLEESNEKVLIDAPSGESFTLEMMRKRMEALAKGLKRELKLGSDWRGVIGLFSANNIDSPTVFWATQILGGAVSPANPGYGATELEYQLKDSGAVALVTSSALLPTALKAIKDTSIPSARVYILDEKHHSKHRTVEQLIQEGSKFDVVLPPLNLKKGDAKTRMALICYSSGTTGLPKGVMISHYNMIANILQIWLLQKEFDDKKRGITLGLLPFYHIYGLVFVMHAEIFLGNTLVVVPAFNFPTFCSYIQKYRMSKLFLVPPVVIRLVKDPLTSEYDLSSLEQITCGAAPLGSDTMALMHSKFKDITFKQAYGMTETATVITAQQETDLVDGSSGVLVPNMEAMLIDPTTGKEITKHDTPGELWVCGPNITMGYLHKEKATNETYTMDKAGRRWLHTGDEVEIRLSKSGNEHYWIVDRIKELIKVKGFQVPPAELEALLLSHELIEDAAVIGIPDEYSGELPKAFVVLKTGTMPSRQVAREIQKFVEEKKVKYKWLTGGVEFLEIIPKTASGKILRKDLRLKEKEKLKAKL